jgi:hypothetical protein
LRLAADLPTIWNAPTTDMRLKQRIVHILIEEIVADVDEAKSELVLIVHWVGGRHTELRVPKNKTGQHGKRTGLDVVEIVKAMAGRWPDADIASTLNRLGHRTGSGNTWTETRVRSLRHYHGFPAHEPNKPASNRLTMEQAATKLGVSATLVRNLIKAGVLPATQVVPCAPWEIDAQAIDTEAVQDAVRRAQARIRPRTRTAGEQTSMFPGM